MNTTLSHKTSLLIAGIFIVLSTLAGAFFVKNYDISISPKNPPNQGCTFDAKMCPDGSSVGRVPPSCEFAACPNVAVSSVPEPTNGGSVGVVSIAPGISGEGNPMAKVPNLLLNTIPTTPQTVQFIIEHRTALNEQQITVSGIIVGNNLHTNDCPPGRMCPDMYIMPSIIVADSQSSQRNTLYDLRINMSEEARAQADQYPIGTKVTITGTISGSLDGVIMTK